MSELTQCNRCSLREIRKRARYSGDRVITRHGDPGEGLPSGVDVLVVPPGEKPDRGKHFAAWFYELTQDCCC